MGLDPIAAGLNMQVSNSKRNCKGLKAKQPRAIRRMTGGAMNQLFAQISTAIAYQTGRSITFVIAGLLVVAWLASGPLFHYSDTWQLVINTATSVLTFLMVFVIQNTQNRDGAAIQAKLDELIRTSAAQNKFIGIEQLTAEEIMEYREHCQALARKALERATKHPGKG
jgi:low affinity Fe/Cu permease